MKFKRLLAPSSLISEMPVTISLESDFIMGAPKKSVGSVQDEWCVEPYGLHRYWGYVFKYNLCLYQLDQDEMLGSLTAIVTLTSNDSID